MVHGKQIPPVHISKKFPFSYLKAVLQLRHQAMKEVLKGKAMIGWARSTSSEATLASDP